MNTILKKIFWTAVIILMLVVIPTSYFTPELFANSGGSCSPTPPEGPANDNADDNYLSSLARFL